VAWRGVKPVSVHSSGWRLVMSAPADDRDPRHHRQGARAGRAVLASFRHVKLPVLDLDLFCYQSLLALSYTRPNGTGTPLLPIHARRAAFRSVRVEADLVAVGGV
jgi:hypothetical protein